MGAGNWDDFWAPLMVLVNRGPRFWPGFWALVSFVRPGKRGRTTGGAGRENGSLTRRDRLAVGPRKTLKEIPFRELAAKHRRGQSYCNLPEPTNSPPHGPLNGTRDPKSETTKTTPQTAL